MGTDERLWHGGPPDLHPGDLIFPDPDRAAHLLDGCPTCEARRAGAQLPEDDNDPTVIYITSDREYARLYAAGWPRGDLYRVNPNGPLTPTDDPLPSWSCASATVVSVYDRCVRLAPARVRRIAARAGVVVP